MRGLHHLFIVFQWWSAGPWFWKPYGLGSCIGFFPPFPHYFIFFLPFQGIFAILEEFWIFLEEKRGFRAFWRHFQAFWRLFDGFVAFLEAFQAFWRLFSGIFRGNMVGKWTNEPCSGVDEVVNTFWVLTNWYTVDCPTNYYNLLVHSQLGVSHAYQIYIPILFN